MRKLMVCLSLVVILSLLAAGNVRPAAAITLPIETDTVFCDHIDFHVTDFPPNLYSKGDIYGPNGYHATVPFQFDANGTGSVTVPYSLPVGTQILYGVQYTFIADVPACPTNAVTFFSPGDGRINPLPGDRIAVYCNPGAAPTIGVYGIDNQSVGIELENVLISSIQNAGAKGVTIDLGNLGSLFISGSGDQFWVDWNGPFNATSSAPFDKLVTCDF